METISENSYKGKDAKTVWDEWTTRQRAHFLKDHTSENKASRLSLLDKKYSELNSTVQEQITNHIYDVSYGAGGNMPYPEGDSKIKKVMTEFKEGKLYTPQGKKVTNKSQAVAIALSEQRAIEKGTGGNAEEVDLFKDYANLPKVKKVVDKYCTDSMTYASCKKLEQKLKPLGYTFEYGLDAEPYGLKKIEEKKEGGNAGSFKDELKNAIQAIFPESYVSVVSSKIVGQPFITVRFTIGKNDTEYNNRIMQNDKAYQGITISNVDDEGNPKGKLEVVGGSHCGMIYIQPQEKHYAMSRVKTGWRNFTADKDKTIKRLTDYFENVKTVLIENKEKLFPETKKMMEEKGYFSGSTPQMAQGGNADENLQEMKRINELKEKRNKTKSGKKKKQLEEEITIAEKALAEKRGSAIHWHQNLTDEERELACSIANRKMNCGAHVDKNNMHFVNKTELVKAIEKNEGALSEHGKTLANSILGKLK